MQIVAQGYPNNERRLRISSHLPDKELARDRDSSLTLAANFSSPVYRSSAGIKTRDGEVLPGYGCTPLLTKFGLRAKRTILRVGGVMDKLPGWNLCVTLTLPADTRESFHALARYSSYAIDRFKDWLKFQVRGGKNLRYFYVWELQKRGALHIHLCVNVPTRLSLRRVKQQSKSAWIRVLKSIGRHADVDMFQGRNGCDWNQNHQKIQVDVQTVRKGVSAYFAKYCGKDKNAQLQHIEAGLRPVRWWGCSRQLLREMRDASVTYTTPIMHPSQCMGLLSKLAEAMEKMGGKVFKFQERYTPYLQIVAYLPPEKIKRYDTLVSKLYKELQVCKLRKMTTHPRYESVKNGFEAQWVGNNTRVRLYNCFKDDRDAWNVFTYWMVDHDAVEQDVVVELWDRFIVLKDKPENALGEPQQLDFLGDIFY